jgi:DNA-binding MarR family transcriptional regulator
MLLAALGAIMQGRPGKTMPRPASHKRIDARASALDYGPLNDRLGYALRRAQIAVFRDFFDAFAEFDIRPGQYSVLTIVERNPGLSQTQVCDALGIQKANFVSVLDILVERGLVDRKPTPKDRRSYALFLTGAGKLLIRKLHRVAEAREQRYIRCIGTESYRRTFTALWALAALDGEQADNVAADAV